MLHTIDDLIKQYAVESKDTPLVGYPREGLTDYEEHTAGNIDEYMNAGAARLQELGLQPAVSSNISVPSNNQCLTVTPKNPELEEAPVAAILAPSSFDYVVTLLSLSRIGYAVFCLSTRLTVPAYSQLLEQAGCQIVVTVDQYASTVAQIQQERKLTSLQLLHSTDYRNKQSGPYVRSTYDPTKESKKRALIIHSSGSTGNPKPIYLTHAACLANFPKHLNMRAFTTSPLFHSHGLYELFRSIYSKKIIYLCNYSLPLTRQGLLATLQHLKPDLFHCVPYVLKLLCESEEAIQELSNCELVLYAGSGCPEDVGDRLVERGVNLAGNYGATETGRLMTSFREPGDRDWNYLRFQPGISEHVLMDKIDENLYECVALESLPSICATNSDDPPNSFRTRDLFTPHPNRAGLWKYATRLDDRLTLVNGEKVLPLPIEGRIRQELIVQEAAVFGAGRTVPGVLIFRAQEGESMTDEEYLAAVWSAVQAANVRAETFSRIPKDLVVILPRGSSYPRTDKGTFIRAKVYDKFKDQIDRAYEQFENCTASSSLSLDLPELEEWLLERFRDELHVELALDSDFFQAGIDSLQCTRMWSLIKRELDLSGRQSDLSRNVLYESGNMVELAQHLYSMRTAEGKQPKDELSLMGDMIAKYSQFQPHQPGKATMEGDVVLLTGATGTLGGHVLAQVAGHANVSRIWALTRAVTDDEASARVFASLETHGLHLDATERSKVVPFAGSLSLADLGLEGARSSRLKESLSVVIHSAWAVNFNLGVKSFEDQHIRGTHNLIQLCLSINTPQPARFFFCSSVSAAGNTPLGQTVREAPVEDLKYAQSTGYGRSKVVTEHIVRNAMLATGIHARVLRLGQLSGDSVRGNWNTTEAIPLMIQSALTTGALPTINEEYSWLPMDYAARIVLELAGITQALPANRSQDTDLVYNVQNPNTFHWTTDLLPALDRCGLSFDQVTPLEWVKRLRKSDQNPERNPPVKLTGFFADRYGNSTNDKQMRSAARYETAETAKDSPTMRCIPDLLEEGLIDKYVRYWKTQWTDGV